MSTASVARERDSAELPELMRRDVRLLGDVLGEVITESDGPDLLADVERLRHAVISARQVPDRASPDAAAAGDAIAALVASWSRARAEQVARAFTVYFHLANLAEEQQRVRTLRSRDAGDTPPRESFADAVARITAEQGRAHVDELLAGLRVHPVFTAHPTEARRRAGSAGCSPLSTTSRAARRSRRRLVSANRKERHGGGSARRWTCCGGQRSSGWPGWPRPTRSARS